MRKRSSRKLAGCIVIELALAGCAVGTDFPIFAPFSNEESAAPLDERVRTAVQSVLGRVK